ncbi:hypothetical protein RHSP_67412 [Rhizobium freirei PRF 81]|uniref:YjiS-like domain-containing protein n=1 Tax=Rhizobium freirei PRF 81 TaxID=363754 RepID=N6UA98_9HYPH|nr:hypothetical protein RHSP_67412 [Rhizobium freirei PRF 81]
MAIDTERSMVAAPGAGSGRQEPRFLRIASAILLSYFEKRNTRRDLHELTDDQLLDIGLTRREADAEVSKSWFWS